MLAGTLLLIRVIVTLHAIGALHAALLSTGHVENRGSFARVVDDDVVDVVIVDDVRDVPTLASRLRALLLLAGRWPTAP